MLERDIEILTYGGEFRYCSEQLIVYSNRIRIQQADPLNSLGLIKSSQEVDKTPLLSIGSIGRKVLGHEINLSNALSAERLNFAHD
jgi:hypothetical protein